MEGEVLQDADKSNFHVHESKSHANAIPGSITKGQIRVRINVVLVLLAEPGPTGVDEDKLTKHKIRSSSLFDISYTYTQP